MMKMGRLTAVLATCWLGSGGLLAAPGYKVVVQNAVGACLRVEARPAIAQGNLLLLPTEITVKQSVARCGCKAAALGYRVSDRKGRQTMAAEIWTLDRDLTKAPFDFSFVLSPDASIRYEPPFQLNLGCAAAD